MTTVKATPYIGAGGDTGALEFTNAGVTMTYNIHLMCTIMVTPWCRRDCVKTDRNHNSVSAAPVSSRFQDGNRARRIVGSRDGVAMVREGLR